eukprot:s6011_g7.t1
MQAERVLKTLEESDAIQGVVLKKRIRQCRFATLLGEVADRKKGVVSSPLDWTKYRQAVEGLAGKDGGKALSIPVDVCLCVVELEAVNALELALAAKSDQELINHCNTFAGLLVPLSDVAAEQFDISKPRLPALVDSHMSSVSCVQSLSFEDCVDDSEAPEAEAAGSEPKQTKAEAAAEQWKAKHEQD